MVRVDMENVKLRGQVPCGSGQPWTKSTLQTEDSEPQSLNRLRNTQTQLIFVTLCVRSSQQQCQLII